jgi:hypothetical protein
LGLSGTTNQIEVCENPSTRPFSLLPPEVTRTQPSRKGRSAIQANTFHITEECEKEKAEGFYETSSDDEEAPVAGKKTKKSASQNVSTYIFIN